MLILCFKCGGKRSKPPSVVPPEALALVTEKFRPAARSFFASKAGYASLRLSMKPSDKLSPNTRMVFVWAAEADCAKTTDMIIMNVAMHFIEKTSNVQRPTPNVQRQRSRI